MPLGFFLSDDHVAEEDGGHMGRIKGKFKNFSETKKNQGKNQKDNVGSKTNTGEKA